MTEFEKAKNILKTASRSGSRLGLERIYELTDILGSPQNKLRTVHIAGTNGKGSFCAMFSAALTRNGYKTGVFSSPVMLKINDCVRINGNPVDKDIFANAVLTVDKAAQKMTDKPTEFEMLTAAAFLIFSEQKCDIAVIECGMGGDTDSTNIIQRPLLSVITNVTIDHRDYLGNTVTEIASHKAGIIKTGVPVFFGGSDKEALKVISETAARKGSELYTLSPDDFSVNYSCTDAAGEFKVTYKGTEYTTSLRGSYQVNNLMNVLSCIDILRCQGIELSENLVKEGITSARWEGRFEKLCDKPLIIFDGAHNTDGMKQLCTSIELYFNTVKPVALIGVLADKDYRSYAEMLRPLVSRAYAVSPDSPRALPAEKLADSFNSSGLPAKAYPDIHSGLSAAFAYCDENSLPLLVIGSLYMYKDIKYSLDKICSK